MNVTLTRRARTLLLFLSASAFIAWFSGLGERSDAAGYQSSLPQAAPTPRFEADPNISATIVRDPFLGVLAHSQISARAVAASAPSSRDHPLASWNDPKIGLLDVPDIQQVAGAGQLLPLVVRATIEGTHPLAYVENGATMDIVRTGDVLEGERVVKIDLRGVTFGDGSRLDLPQSFSVTPAPAPAAISLAHQIEEVRKLLVSRKTTSTPTPASAGPVASSVPATPSYPTPAALPTADTRGIPVGTNPSPDVSGPTPYPDPYPYSPTR
jgi:hypothetical protein